MRIGLAAALLIACGGGAVAAAQFGPVQGLAGRYSRHFQNGLVSGERYASDDVVEIVPIDAGHAYVRLSLQFYNGHSCGLWGVARAERDELVYREPASKQTGDKPCTISLWREGNALAWTDNGSCSAYCGARGSLKDGSLPWASKRPIKYMTRLKGSSEYRGALDEWHSGGAQ